MATEFRLPELGENVESGTVARVLIAVGDTLSEGDPVLEIETDKASAEIPSEVSGTITEIRVEEGQSVSPGDVVLVVDESGTGGGETDKKPAKEEKPDAAEKEEGGEEAEKPATRTQAAAAPAKKTGGPVLASPSVRRLARERGVSLEEVPVSDPSGRLTARDIEEFAKDGSKSGESTPAASESSAPAAPASAAGLEDLEKGEDSQGPVAYLPMNNIRKKTAEHMTHCWTTIPHVTHFDKADVTDLEGFREKYGAKIEKAGGKLTPIAFVLKALAAAFQRYPKCNASTDLENERIVLRQYCHIGVAVDTPNGLLVPVLRNVDRMSLLDISVQLPAMAKKARDKKLALDEMQGGGFTVTNLGGIGGTAFTPIINAPQAAILGMSRNQIEAVWRDGAFVPRTMLPLSLSYDHRIIDGADAARFTRFICEALENPWTMFLGL
jgi:pyruvate dehydrogenase E2 component (dihydrolipoamide acetyltransferase)